MDILLLLIPLSVALVLAIGAAFWWSASHGQFDDLDGPAYRILADDDLGAASAHPLTSVKPPLDEKPQHRSSSPELREG